MVKIKEKIKEIVSKYGKNEKDVGSPEVQVAILTEEILNLSKHLKDNKKDKSSKRGLILKIVQRKKLLHYLKRTSYSRYKKIVEDLNL
ncbi:MAG: 30S ribosomal protein S15 [Patescibacteria group bacterium]|nr:30S ribosomal protein S15 [Patescibacteria group bacterium]